MNLRIVFRFKDCKLQFYEKRRLFSYSIENPRTPASHWLLFHPATILSKKGRHFRLLITRQKLSNPLKSLKSGKCLKESTNRASEYHSPHHIYNSLLRMRAIHELKTILILNPTADVSPVRN